MEGFGRAEWQGEGQGEGRRGTLSGGQGRRGALSGVGACLLGFNPAQLSRNVAIKVSREDLNMDTTNSGESGKSESKSESESSLYHFKTFRDVTLALSDKCDAIYRSSEADPGRDPDSRKTGWWYSLINPVLGPEPVAGSSRMKVISHTICLHYMS